MKDKPNQSIVLVQMPDGRMSKMMNRRRTTNFLIVGMTLVSIVSILKIMEFRNTLDSINENLNTKDDIDRDILNLMWPIFPGADTFQTTAKTSKPDPLLLAKLLNSMKILRTPKFRVISDTETDSWKFPRIFHQSWVSESIPEMTSQWVKKWLEIHPDWTYIFWTDKSAREFVKDYFPSLLPHYDAWRLPVQRADMFRYIAIYAFGGVWGDMDMEPLKSLEPIRDWSSCILSQEPDAHIYVMSNFMNNYANNWTFACNAFFACKAHHPFMFYMISRTISNSPLIKQGHCSLSEVIQCTGPWLMSWVYAYYQRSIPQHVRKEYPEYDVICPEYEYFLPTFDETRRDSVMETCGTQGLEGRQKEACRVFASRNFQNKPLNYSYTDHHWFHSYHYDVGKSSVPISDVTQMNVYTDPIFEISYE